VSQTVLLRADLGASSVRQLLIVDNGASGVTIQNLKIDGNRFGIPALRCLPGNDSYWDVDMSHAGSAALNIVDNVKFYNAPATALIAGGYTAVIYSEFFNARSTALWLDGPPNATPSFHSGAWYNTFVQSGTAAINAQGKFQEFYGNTLLRNRYEQSDGFGGGQFFIDPVSTYASVVANVIDGDHWTTTSWVNGCPTTPGLWVQGVEAYGEGHRFFNNQVMRNSAAGMNIGGVGLPAWNILVSSDNPWLPGDVPRYVTENEIGGIAFLGYSTTGLTLDHVRSTNNLREGVYLEGASGPGFINDACIVGNQIDIWDIGPPYLTNRRPGRSDSCP